MSDNGIWLKGVSITSCPMVEDCVDFCVTLCPVTKFGNSSFAAIKKVFPFVSMVSSLQLLSPNGMAGGGPTACGVWREVTIRRKNSTSYLMLQGFFGTSYANGKWAWDFELGINVRSLHKTLSLKF